MPRYGYYGLRMKINHQPEGWNKGDWTKILVVCSSIILFVACVCWRREQPVNTTTVIVQFHPVPCQAVSMCLVLTEEIALKMVSFINSKKPTIILVTPIIHCCWYIWSIVVGYIRYVHLYALSIQFHPYPKACDFPRPIFFDWGTHHSPGHTETLWFSCGEP